MNVAVNYAKGIAIILMVLLHSSRWIESGYLGHVVCLFHMPLFFFMAGYCFKEKYLSDFRTFAKKRFLGLWKPYVKYGLLFLLLHNVFFHLHIYDSIYGSYTGITSCLYGMKDYLLQFQRILRMVGSEQLLGGYWFLPTLFYASIIAYITIRYVRNSLFGGGILLALTLAFLVTDRKIPFFGIDDKMSLGALFFYLGYLCKGYQKKFDSKKVKVLFLLLAIMVVVAIAWTLPSSMPTMETKAVIPYVIAASLASTSIFMFCQWLVKYESYLGSILNYIGMHTIEILTWHFLLFKLVSLLIVNIYRLPINSIASFPTIQEYSCQGWWIAYTMVGVFIPVLGAYIKNKIIQKL